MIAEGMSRAVTGGLVDFWRRDSDPYYSLTGNAVRWTVRTIDGRQHSYTNDQAEAFADAVFAAEQAATR